MNTAYLTAADLGARVLSFAIYVVMARRLGDANFGIFALGIALGAVTNILANFGQDPVLVREVVRAPEKVSRFLVNTLTMKLVLALGSTGIAYAALTAAGVSTTTRIVVLLLTLTASVGTLTGTCCAVFRAFDRFSLVPVVMVTTRLLTAALAIPALLLGAGVITVAAIYLVASAVGLALALVFVFRTIGRPRFRLDLHSWRWLMRAALPIGLASILIELLFRVDTAMLAAYEPAEVVGNYAAAYRVFEAALFITIAVGDAAFPRFALYGSTRDPAASVVLTRVLKLGAAATIPLAVATGLLADPLVESLFGPGFAEAGDALRLLAPAFYLTAVAKVVGSFLIARGHQSTLAWISGVVLAENIVGNLILIPLLSLNGAALGTSISEGLFAVGLVVAVTLLGAKTDWRRVLLGPCMAAALMAPVLLELRDQVWVAVGVGAATYLVALLVVERIAYPDDASALTSMIRG
jgi:O-antigen/teichoic acid export membrane protein